MRTYTKLFVIFGLFVVLIVVIVWLGTFASGASGPMHGSPTFLPHQQPDQELNISDRFKLQSFDSEEWPIVVLKSARGESIWSISLQDDNPSVSGAKRIRFNDYVHFWPLNEIRIKGTIEYQNVGYGQVQAPTVWIIATDGRLKGFTIDS